MNGFLDTNGRDVRRLQGETERVGALQQTVLDLQAQIDRLQTAVVSVASTELPPVVQLARNTDFAYSVNGYLNSVSAPGNQEKELAYFFAHAADVTRTVNDGAITAGDNTFTSPSGGFVPGDVGKIIIIDGAGAAGRPHATTIASFTSSNEVEITAAAITTVGTARSRWRCVKLTKKNAKTDPGETVTDSVKASDHANAATNLKSPQWLLSAGIVRLGSTNTLTYFNGIFGGDGSFTPSISPFRAGKEVWVGCKIARKNRFVRVKGYLFAGLWDNSDTALEYLKSSRFIVSGAVVGTPAATETTRYYVVSKSGSGRFFAAEAVVPNAPALNAYSPPNVQVNLSWDFIPGIIETKIYRKIGAGNVFLLETVPTGNSRYFDTNPATRTDTGSQNFPVVSGSIGTAGCYVETNDFSQVVVDGSGDWQPMFLQIPVAGTTDFSQVTELALRFGFTEACSYVLDQTTVNGTTQITSPHLVFSADWVGKNVVVTDPVNPARRVDATIAAYVSPGVVTLNNAIFWTAGDAVLEILEADPHAVSIDLFAVSFTRGAWSAHPDDANRLLPVSSLPVSTTQGGGTNTGGGPNYVPNYCVWTEAEVTMSDGEKLLACQLEKGDKVFYGRQGFYNIVKSAEIHTVYEYYEVFNHATKKTSKVTGTHRFIKDAANLRDGTPVEKILSGENILLPCETFDTFSPVSLRLIKCPEGLKVVTIELEHDSTRPEETRLLIVDGNLSHNLKQLDPILH